MSELNPYAPPVADVDSVRPETTQAFWRDGDALVMARSALVVLPDRCVHCNAPAGGFKLKRTVHWHNPLLYLLIVISILVYVVVALVVRKSIELEVGLCERHRLRHKLGFVLLGAGLLLPLLVGVAHEPLGSAVLPLALVTLLGGVIPGVVLSRVVQARRMDREHAWLKVGAAFLASVAARPESAR